MKELKRGFNIVVGGMAGSEAKGKLSGWLCDRFRPDLVVMSSSPNAGHTVVTDRKYVTYNLPVGAVMCDAPIVLTAASLVNVGIMKKEIEKNGINPERITIDPRASVITEEHINAEMGKGLSDIGSTLQGISEARMAKIRRDGSALFASDCVKVFDGIGVRVSGVPISVMINDTIDHGGRVLCETTQGFELDLNHGIDRRYCTSKMINPAMAMAEAGVPPSRIGNVYGVIRPYPIRVNNRTGTSGPYTGAQEISWQDVAHSCGYGGDPSEFGEITTTTKLPRRVFTFSWERFNHFIRICRPDSLCLQFANYVDWSVFRSLSLTDKVRDFVIRLQKESGVPVDFIGTGPENRWMIEVEAGVDEETE